MKRLFKKQTPRDSECEYREDLSGWIDSLNNKLQDLDGYILQLTLDSGYSFTDNGASNPDSTSIPLPNQEVYLERELNVTVPSNKDPRHARLQHVTGNDQHDDRCSTPGNWMSCLSSTIPINLRGSLVKFWSDIRRQTRSQPLIAISFMVILLMQVCFFFFSYESYSFSLFECYVWFFLPCSCCNFLSRSVCLLSCALAVSYSTAFVFH